MFEGPAGVAGTEVPVWQVRAVRAAGPCAACGRRLGCGELAGWYAPARLTLHLACAAARSAGALVVPDRPPR